MPIAMPRSSAAAALLLLVSGGDAGAERRLGLHEQSAWYGRRGIGSASTDPARSVPRVRLVLIERHWDRGGERPDTSVIDVAVVDSLGTPFLLRCKKPLVLVGVLPGCEALVRYADCLVFQRSDSRTRPGSRRAMGWGGPIGPETLVVRSTWARLSTPTEDAGCDYSIRLLTP